MEKEVRSIEQRNQLVEQYLWCIDTVMRQNYTLIKGAHLDRDDVYQALAERLIRAVERYDPSKGDLKQHIFAQLKYELLSCNSPLWKFGFREAPYSLRGVVVSLDSLREATPQWERRLAA